MLAALTPHGPDSGAMVSAGAGTESSVILGHRVLQITPEDAFESQPIQIPKQLLLVADARLDNRAELAGKVNIPPGELIDLPDSALLLHAWLRWGTDCLDHLAGGFALAVWEPRLERLFLARDHSGERPLYFRQTANSLLFATTARAIRACPGVSSELDEVQLARDLIGIPPEYPRTRFREIGEVAPGHCLIVSRNGERLTATHRRYWEIHSLRTTRYARDQDYADGFLEVFDRAVESRLRTTGKVASELSAGLDSSAVTATAARLLAGSGQALTAYTSVPCPEFQGPVPAGLIADEGPAAAEVAALYPNIQHVRVSTGGSDMLRELARLHPLLDIPHAAALNAVWSNLIYDHARATGVNVVLSGALGNFAVSYAGGDILHTLFRQGRWLKTLRTAIQLRRMGISSGRNAASLTVFGGFPWALRRRIDPLIRRTDISWSALRRDRANDLNALDQFRRYLFTHVGALPRLMESQFGNNQYGDYNAAASAGWGIDVRDPTADRRVFEFCASIPPEQFITQGKGRSLIRRAMRDRLPESTLNRREKGTQAADWYENLTRIRSELCAEVARLEQSAAARGLIDLDLLRSALEHWPVDARDAARQAGIYQSAIPRGIATGYFIRKVEEESVAFDAAHSPI